jgi:hypothetical protein
VFNPILHYLGTAKFNNKYINSKPCLYRSTDYLTDDAFGDNVFRNNCINTYQTTPGVTLHLKYERVCLHVIFKYTMQNEVNDHFNDDTEVCF